MVGGDTLLIRRNLASGPAALMYTLHALTIFYRAHHILEQDLLRRNVQRFQGGLACKAHRLIYHSTLGLRVVKEKGFRLRGDLIERNGPFGASQSTVSRPVKDSQPARSRQ